ncbi:MAG: single-stranded-DNA-specific exonuclease RecJ [Planctomycetes bacterium]|nr:single-stranded-DNA-specific exonuclease RecJ [Planctomycetota bacterium]
MRDKQAGQGELLDRVLVARGITDPEVRVAYLHPASAVLDPAGALPGVDKAVDRILAAVRAKERIAIYGDYDVDGVTSTALLTRVLRAIDPTIEVEPYIPHRLEEGYGLNIAALESLRARGTDLIITVDCGITAVAEAQRCAELGVDLIITDHHQPSEDGLPEVAAIVHPGLPGSKYAWPILSGSAVAYKLARHLVSVHEDQEAVSDQMTPLLRDSLCLAGMGVIADVVPLVGENRRMAAKALRLMPRCNFPGVTAMLLECVKKGESINSETVGYRIGPRLNAAGRLGHAQDALELLLTDDEQQARKLAKSLSGVNTERQAVAREIEKQACMDAESAGMTGPESRMIVLANEAWHPGVVGIVCSRLVEKYARPTVLLGSVEGGMLRGSARSIDGYSIHDALQSCREHFTSCGGHAMAAGMSLRASNFAAAQKALCDHAASKLSREDLVRTLVIDTEGRLEEMTPAAVDSLQQMQPAGRCNETPRVLLRELRIEGSRPMGKGNAHLQLKFNSVRAPWFGHGHLVEELPRGALVDVVVEPSINVWQGRKSVDLLVKDLIRH